MQRNSVFTIGYSNMEFDDFVSVLKTNKIDMIVDVRSYPYSKFNQDFCYNNLKEDFKKESINYVFAGISLGGKPKNKEFYIEGQVSYELITQSKEFQDKIHQIIKSSANHNLALMCSEKDPIVCHRMLMIAKALKREVDIIHLIGNEIETQEESERRMLQKLKLPFEGTLFESAENVLEKGYKMQIKKHAFKF